MAHQPGHTYEFLDSVHKLIKFRHNKAVLKFAIPRDAPPSLSLDKYSIEYFLELICYAGLTKTAMVLPFNLSSSYIFDHVLDKKLRITDDMMSRTDSSVTIFNVFVNKLRNCERVDNCLSLKELVDYKAKALQNFYLDNTFKNCHETGDVWFYRNDSPLVLENKIFSIDLQMGGANFATLFYNKYIKKHLNARISFYESVNEIEFKLKKQVCDELDEFIIILKSDVTGCIYRCFECTIPNDIPYSLNCGFFKIQFFLVISIDHFSFEVPITIVDPNSNIIFNDDFNV